jgi:DNA-binding MarR family transcriptional regulator
MSTPTVALRRLIAQSIAMHEAVAASLGINSTDLRCLELLQDAPAITPSGLAELAGLTTGAITGVLDRLEAAGFVRREVDLDDRRRIIVRPLPDRMAEVAAAYQPLLSRADGIGRRGPELTAAVDTLIGALTGETERLRVATEGGLLGDTYRTPMLDVRRARLHLRTGAPRLNLGGSGFGQQVRMVAETAATRLRLGPASEDAELLRATFVGPPPDIRRADGFITMRYRRRLLDTRSREIDARLHHGVAWSIEVDGGISDLDGDFRELQFEALEIHGGSNHLRLRLPRPSGTVRILLVGGASDVRLSRPAEVPVAVASRGGVAHLLLDQIRREGSGTDLRLESRGYEAIPDRYLLELEGSVAQLRITAD